MASTVLPNGIIIPEKYSRDWYADLYHNWQELDNLLGTSPGDGTLTIQKNGTTVGTFSANQATDETINIEVPTKTSDLSNDSGYITGVSWNDVSNKPSFATVATSGSYNDLSNKPTIPTVNDATLTIQKNGTTVDTFTANSSSDKTVNISVPTKTSDLTNDSGYITGVSWNDVSNKPSFATVATSGSYNDLSNKPTIPTVNDATLTIQKNGTTVDTFTANSSSDKTVNIQCVDLTNNQTVGGIKTFSNAPVVNSISLDGKTIDTDANGNMTYDSHIVDTIEEQGEEYIRYSNGIQICWGYVDAGVTVTINFPKSFLKRPSISVTSNTTDTNSVVTAQATNQTMTACCNFEYYGSFYIAIGRWK